ncbi:NACHT domain-containing protein, partial [Scytonema sp. PCC 10023]|uniref:NACHT domain-containing protein n=1 Tax=Scytonema sp. PCC 10023 TaxID=1680591 RepID=UPI0039C6F604
MNRVVAWGISSTIGFVFKTVLEELAREELQEYTKTFFQKTFPTLQELQVQDKLELAFGQALKELLQLVQDELENADCSDAEIKQYIYPLKKFIRHRIVLVELGKPFGAGICHADSFAKTWCELNLKPLPDEFAWEEIIKRYIKQVNAIRKESHDLHTLFNLPNKAIEQNRKENAASVPNFGLFDLEDYRKTIEKTYGYLKLDSFATDGYSYKLKLEKMFVPQNVREVQEAFPQVYERPKEHLERLERLKKNNQLEEYEEYAEYVDISPEVLERYKQAYREQTTRSVEEMIEDERNYQYTVILGDPGSGKSSLLQYLALKWAEAPIEKVSAMPIPLLVELRTYVQNRDNQKSQNSLDFFQQYKGFIYSINLQQLSHFLQTGKGFVMFDGLDEIFDPNQREEVIIDIINFTKTYPGVRVIVTSRVIGYKPQLLGNAKFRHFMLQDLELEQIEHFLETWHDLAFGNSYEKERKRERLRAAIHAYAPIRELAGNPLLLTMMAILNRNQELPRFRAELYNKASRVLLQQWDVERALVDKTISVDYKDKQAILRQVAYHMQTNKKGGAGNLINSEKLERILNSYLQKIKVNNSTNVAKLIIQQLRERNFILCFMGADYYAFVHRTFLEYFCATEYVWQFEEERSITLNELKTDIFGKYWQDESWHEVLRLIAGMLNARFIGEIIDELMEKNGEAQKFSNLFLAAQCFSEVKDSESISPTATRLLEQLKKLTNYDLHYYYDPYALEETSLVFKIRTQAVAAVATTWKDDPETLSWLKTRATSDEDYDVRRAAVEELAKAFKDDPETLTIL